MKKIFLDKRLQHLLLALGLVLGLGACARMAPAPSLSQQAGRTLAVQEGRLRILSLSPQVSQAELAPVRHALETAQREQNQRNYPMAVREILLARLYLDNIQNRIDSSSDHSGNARLREQIRETQIRIGSLRQKIAQTRQQLGETAQ